MRVYFCHLEHRSNLMMVSGFDNEVSMLTLNIKIKIIINEHTASVELIAGFIKDVS